MKQYVVGFAFNDDLSHVVLVKKNRPEWQAGLYNAVGGHIEPNETDLEAMVREFAEEAGVNTEPSKWVHIGMLFFPEARLSIFALRDTEVYAAARTCTDEEVFGMNVCFMHHVVSNVPQLTQLCLLHFRGCLHER